MALEAQDKSREARQTLAQVLKQAEPEGYVRLFVDAGSAGGTLVVSSDRARSRARLCPAPARGFSQTDWSPQPDRLQPSEQPEDLIEPLSDRELEVLRLIDQGLSNSEIAAKLVLSTGTVKVHTHNIFSKLGVSSRTQAVSKARALGLL